jgi:hypothetical protein
MLSGKRVHVSAFLVDHVKTEDNPASIEFGFALNSVIVGGGGAALDIATLKLKHVEKRRTQNNSNLVVILMRIP